MLANLFPEDADPEDRSDVVNWRLAFKKHTEIPSEILIFGGYCGPDPRMCIAYSVYENKWSTFLAEMQVFRRTPAGVRCADGSVLVTGSAVGQTQESCELYLPAQEKWLTVAGMRANRCFHAAVLADRQGPIAVGGQNASFRVLRSLENYNADRNEWNMVGCMAQARRCFGAASMGNAVYVCGGLGNRNTALASTELFDTRAGPCAITRKPLPAVRSGLTLTTVSPFGLIAAGGMQRSHSDAAAWLYDTRADRWTSVAPMQRARSSHCAVAVDGLLYVMGGAGSTDASVERYYPQQNRWETVAPMPSKRMLFGAVALR